MKILILGGTGAMGMPLIKLLSDEGHKLYVTTRNKRTTVENIEYLIGNAMDDNFLIHVLKRTNYDIIVDFMVYSTEQFGNRVNAFLDSTDHYIFISSSRVYANSNTGIEEGTLRLLDSIDDDEYLKTDEYALRKARSENFLFKSEKRNWTIVRPYITYNYNRFQLGIYEKEQWLYRALHGRTVVVPKAILDSTTTLTYGGDVAQILDIIINNTRPKGDVFNPVSDKYMTWREIAEIYRVILKKLANCDLVIKEIDNIDFMTKIMNAKYQVKYDRLFYRRFNNIKVINLGKDIFVDPEVGLSDKLKEFIDKGTFKNISWRLEAWMDRKTGERISLREIPDHLTRLKYIIWRYTPYLNIKMKIMD